MDPLPTTYLDYLDARTRARAAEARANLEAEFGPDAEDYPGQRALWELVEAIPLAGDLDALALDLHAHPEEAFQEHYAAGRIADLVGADVGYAGLETALRVDAQTPGFDPDRHPTIAILAEYDALPGIGHGCGHNLIAAAGVGGFLAARRALPALPDGEGRIALIGTPAEEGHSGKEYLIRNGGFEGIDAAIMVHPFGYELAEHVWVGRRVLHARFHGVAAHASAQPFMGRNALDAATLAYQGLGLLRQQMPPCDRLHAILPEGGARPSVIPAEASLTIYARSLLSESLDDLSSRVDDVLHGAALMAGVEVDIEWDIHPATLPVRNNHTIARRWIRSQYRRGRLALPAGVVPDTLAASTDFGNVSQLMPAIHPMIKIAPESVALHTEEMARYAGSPEGLAAARSAASGLAQVALDMVADPRLLREARAEFA